MQTLIVARHAESECSARGIVNGEPNSLCSLTERGEEEARALGRSLAGRELDLYVTSEFRRARQTAEIALTRRELPWLELAELNDIRVGAFEGGPLDLYTSWAHEHEPEERPVGGESRAEAAARFVRGFRIVLARPEPTILVVTHGLVVSYLREATGGVAPRARHAPVPYARPFEYGVEELRQALDLLDAWLQDPHWA
ncbi:MAG: histidine phosphatase family protein [Gaiellaceae bacterium]|jgi:probable phosphoglycerate mutase